MGVQNQQTDHHSVSRKQALLIRIHENRAYYDWHGYLQWKPVGGKTWYVMHMGAIEPENMRLQFAGKWLADMETYGGATKVIGIWNTHTKKMTVERFVELVT